MLKCPIILSLAFCFHFANAQTASFTYAASGALCNPSTISFTPTTSETPIGYTWTFGNGLISNDVVATTTFTTAGTYTVKLVAVFTNTVVETSQTIVINPSITNTLTVDRNYICKPGDVSFTSSSSGNIIAYEWDFGDGVLTTTTIGLITHSYANFGTFTASVKAKDATGCFANATQIVTVQNPPIAGAAAPVNGCVPATVNLTANVTVPIGGSVTSYTWDFNDGSPTATIGNHIYNTAGVAYIPTVAIVTNEGCTNTFNYATLNFGTPPTNHVAFSDKLVYCGSETPLFTATATNANAYIWNFGDGITETVSTNTTTHKYTSLGVKSVTVTPYYNGCAGTPINFSITIVGVIANFSFANTCTNKKTFSFSNTSLGNVTGTVWNFGDGTPTVNTTNATHTFPASGAFTTTLLVSDNVTSCTDVISNIIYTANPTLTNPDVFLCRNSSSTFTLQNNYVNNGAVYNWNVLGLGPITNGTNPASFTASVFGNFTNNFVIINNGSQYCLDTISLNQLISVRGPKLSYTAPIVPICAPATVNLLNTSTAYLTGDTVKLWYWNYGIQLRNDTVFQPLTLTYAGVANYTIKLFAKDKNGCVDSLAKIITTKPSPFLRVFPRLDTLCLGQSSTIIAFHSDTLLWSPASVLSCTTCDTTIATPTTSQYIFATAKNSIGCTARDSAFIILEKPFVAAAVTSPVYICLNDSVQINVTPPNKKISWTPATNISNSNIYNPTVSPPNTTTYTATLSDSVNCFTSNTNVVVVVKSLPTVNAGPDLFLPYNIPFPLNPVYGTNIVSYNWIPATNLSCTTCPNPVVTPLGEQQYVIKVTSDSACVAKDTINILVECKYANIFMPNAFTPNGDNTNDIYYPIGRGIKKVTRFIIYNRYGQKVFEAKDIMPNIKNLGWNGKVKGEIQTAGTYVYLLTVTCFTGEIIEKKDSFILIK